ncbi:hypothetical protein [Anianabacter salinae]|uniref:hypothetical protein n=1 Tax=Anianabacter salinae TaxID=2851023 RepID=UPI00225DDD4C|nr:hypothetical protein [Anianabacter salinae]MBV0910886.1 hypothetical protein [Anianabacter salinae]
MFFEEGWTTVADVTDEVTERVQAFHAARAQGGTALPTADVMQTDIAISVWEICDAATKVGAMTPTGLMVPASKLLLAWHDPRKMHNRHIDLRQGVVGSSPDADRAEAQSRYGAFLYQPLAIPTNGVESSLTFLDEELTSQSTRDPIVVDTAKMILAEVKAGALVTKRMMRQKAGNAITRRKFKIAWALAAEAHPPLWTEM